MSDNESERFADEDQSQEERLRKGIGFHVCVKCLQRFEDK